MQCWAIGLTMAAGSLMGNSAEQLNFRSSPMTAGKASLSENGYIVSRELGGANFSPELRYPVQLIYRSDSADAGLFGTSWRSPQLESSATPEKDGVLWTTPWGGGENPLFRQDQRQGRARPVQRRDEGPEAVFFAVLNPGDTFLGLNLSHGGHLSHGSPVNSSGVLYHATEYNVKEDTGRVDYDQMEEVALREKPKLIVGGGSAYSRDWDYKRMREIADKVGALLMIDMAHPAGLIAAGLLNNPLEYAHIVTSTTHKTLRGPRGGIILLGKDFENPWGKKTPKGEIKKMSQLLDSAVFPGIQGGPLEHVIAAKAVAFGEALEPEYKTYQAQVKANAAAMAKAFTDKGYKIISGGTDNHSMLIDLRTKFPDLTGKVAEKALVAADITVNKNMVPFDSRSAFQTSGIRVGTPAITTRGAKEPLMGEIVELIDTVLAAPECDKTIGAVREKVNGIMKEYPIFAW